VEIIWISYMFVAEILVNRGIDFGKMKIDSFLY